MERYANKRIVIRSGGGRFRKAQPSDIGIMGTCPTPGCGHFLQRHYEGDPKDAFPDPRKFVARCFTCKPETDAERELHKSAPKVTLMDIFERIAEQG